MCAVSPWIGMKEMEKARKRARAREREREREGEREQEGRAGGPACIGLSRVWECVREEADGVGGWDGERASAEGKCGRGWIG